MMQASDKIRNIYKPKYANFSDKNTDISHPLRQAAPKNASSAKTDRFAVTDQAVETDQSAVTNRSVETNLPVTPGPNTSKRFALADPWTIVNYTIPESLQGIKSPCFLKSTVYPSFSRNSENSTSHKNEFTNDTISQPLQCLPFFIMIGFPKCGTTDVWYRLTQHKYIFGPSVKEAHWFDSNEYHPWYLNKDNSLNQYCSLFDEVTKIIDGRKDGIIKHRPSTSRIKSPHDNTLLKMNNVQYMTYTTDERRNLVIADFTPAYSWNNDFWSKDPANANQHEPVSLIPHKVKHLLPDAKIMAMVRNPVDRLWSDFEFHFSDKKLKKKSAKHKQRYFDARIKTAIKWWNDCIGTYNLTMRQCAFGNHYPKPLRTLSYFKTRSRKSCHHRFSCDWLENPATALRRGLYYILLKEWYDVFTDERVLVLRAEDYYAAPEKTIQKVVLPFLDTPPFDNYVERNSSNASSKPRLRMLEKTRDLLQRFYSPYNYKLAELLKDKKYTWE